MVVTIIAVAAPIIRSRDPARAPPALAIAAGAAPFLVLSALFDIMSFPHAPYILFTLAGFLSVIAGRVGEDRAPSRRLPATILRSVDRSEPADEPERSIPTPVY